MGMKSYTLLLGCNLLHMSLRDARVASGNLSTHLPKSLFQSRAGEGSPWKKSPVVQRKFQYRTYSEHQGIRRTWQLLGSFQGSQELINPHFQAVGFEPSMGLWNQCSGSQPEFWKNEITNRTSSSGKLQVSFVSRNCQYNINKFWGFSAFVAALCVLFQLPASLSLKWWTEEAWNNKAGEFSSKLFKTSKAQGDLSWTVTSLAVGILGGKKADPLEINKSCSWETCLGLRNGHRI